MRRSNLLFLASGVLLGLLLASGIQLARQAISHRTIASIPAQTPQVATGDSDAIPPQVYHVCQPDDSPGAAERREPMPKWAASQHWINGQRYYIVPLN